MDKELPTYVEQMDEYKKRVEDALVFLYRTHGTTPEFGWSSLHNGGVVAWMKVEFTASSGKRDDALIGLAKKLGWDG